MNLLLDTHSFLWFIMGSPRWSGNARALIEDDTHDKRLSTASLWEMAIKRGLGRLPWLSLLACLFHSNCASAALRS